MWTRTLQSKAAYRLGFARWLFLHVPKNAGVSIVRAPELRWRIIRASAWCLRDRAYVRELHRTMEADGQHHGEAHARLRDIRADLAARLQPVAILRNPWARVVSRYRFACLAAEQRSQFQPEAPPSFEEFLEERHVYAEKPFYWHRAIRGWYPQIDYVTDDKGRIAADILRFEYMDTDVPAYFGLDKPVRPRNVTSHGGTRQPWQEFYSPATIQIVADWYVRDIEAFGFDFDTPATRNVWAGRET